MHVVIVEFTIKPDFIDRFRVRVQQQAQDSLANEAECHVFDVCIDAAAPDAVLLYEVYTDAPAFQGHLETAHFKAFDAEVTDWIAQKTIRQFEKL